MQDDLPELRLEYSHGGLTEEQAGEDPLVLFDRWFAEARRASTGPGYEPNVMTLATVDAAGEPAARIVLLKQFDERGFVFYTNYESDKAAELQAHPHAALVFHWCALERQVRITGRVERVSRQESEDYFADRPRGSQVGAWVSDQSAQTTRDELDRKLAELEQRFEGAPVPCPPHWGGYRVAPSRIEFWSGRPNRLHDRILFTRQDDGSWARGRLSP